MEHSYVVWFRMYLTPTRSPPPSDDEFDNATATTQKSLVRITNAAWDLRMEIVLSKVAMLLAQPFSVVYRTDASRDAVAYVRQATTFFIWMPAKALLRGNVARGVRYVVLFHVTCEEPYRALCLAHTILEYPSVYIALGGNHRFDIIKMCYSFGRNGVHGALCFDHDLSHVYKKVRRYAKANTEHYAMFKGRYPVTIWYAYPDVSVSFGENSLENLEARVRKLL
ncbi:hypothetical protein EST38_g6959 [Candolleomyces aberdarensis]|uniref:Uncharacterized protein n=1 Tax=Candolleomyces aberdarensis TaxID=2316362 RepID=A0A4Q2DGC8_9AGAR|nr:hypothetical protein EST38_g6959 [Candolleomyces aberdarensis]